jgi:fatty acid desaturase
MNRPGRTEWPTLGVIVIFYALWLGLSALAGLTSSPLLWWPAVAALAVVTTFHASLSHEALHGHPTRRAWINEALVFSAVGLFIPYRRFKSLHLRHHANERLTDPYDDPESFYLAWCDWHDLPRLMQVLLRINNTLAGRMAIGPLLSVTAFYAGELKAIAVGDRRIASDWAYHAAGLVPVALWLSAVGFPLWLYAVAVAYPAYALLMLRTFAEHQADENPANQTAIVEASPFFALLFLNNNLHSVHHDHPRLPWYRLPEFCRWYYGERSYRFNGYGDLVRRFAFRAKEPVPHPYLRRSEPAGDFTGEAERG